MDFTMKNNRSGTKKSQKKPQNSTTTQKTPNQTPSKHLNPSFSPIHVFLENLKMFLTPEVRLKLKMWRHQEKLCAVKFFSP